MTIEHRLIFELTDIKAITLECNRCKGRFVQDPKRELKLHANCPICTVEWFVEPTGGLDRAPSAYLALMVSIGKLCQPDTKKLEKVGFTLRLEFDEPRP